MEKILISACFLGANVRYNAVAKPLVHPMIDRWQRQRRLIAVCPEVAGGLSIPRAPAEIKRSSTNQLSVINLDGQNVTDAFSRGAQHALTLCQRHNIKYALLKESSPSCGSTDIYDGSFTNSKMLGEGMTTQLLRQHGIQVFSEQTIADLMRQLNEVTGTESELR